MAGVRAIHLGQSTDTTIGKTRGGYGVPGEAVGPRTVVTNVTGLVTNPRSKPVCRASVGGPRALIGQARAVAAEHLR